MHGIDHRARAAGLAELHDEVGDLHRADPVDKEGRFPAETIEALKRERLLGVAIPIEHGGEGLGTMQIAD
ncbi:MAG: acyl-CoA dehydrogenase family protein, partial [Mesorhizobium sp.]